MIDASVQAAPVVAQEDTRRTKAPTGRWVVIAFLVLSAGVLIARVGTLSDALVAQLPDDVRSDLGDGGLERLAVGVGIILGVVVILVAQVIFLWLARLLERHLFGASLGSGQLRVGLFSTVVMLALLSRQACSLLAAGSTLEAPPYAVPAAVGSALLGLLLFLPQLRRLSWQRALGTSGAAVLLALLTSVG